MQLSMGVEMLNMQKEEVSPVWIIARLGSFMKIYDAFMYMQAQLGSFSLTIATFTFNHTASFRVGAHYDMLSLCIQIYRTYSQSARLD